MLTEAVAQGPVCADLLHRPHQLSHGPRSEEGSAGGGSPGLGLHLTLWDHRDQEAALGTHQQGGGQGEGALGGVLGCLTHSKV